MLTDPAGRLIELSAAYRPPAELRRHVVARDVTRRFPGCARRAEKCEIDHRDDYARGGITCAANLHPLCSRHHHLKHEAKGWSVSIRADGGSRWRSPSGRTHDTPPHRYVDVPAAWSEPLSHQHTRDLAAWSEPLSHPHTRDLAAWFEPSPQPTDDGGYWPDAPPDLVEPAPLEELDASVAHDDDLVAA